MAVPAFGTRFVQRIGARAGAHEPLPASQKTSEILELSGYADAVAEASRVKGSKPSPGAVGTNVMHCNGAMTDSPTTPWLTTPLMPSRASLRDHDVMRVSACATMSTHCWRPESDGHMSDGHMSGRGRWCQLQHMNQPRNVALTLHCLVCAARAPLGRAGSAAPAHLNLCNSWGSRGHEAGAGRQSGVTRSARSKRSRCRETAPRSHPPGTLIINDLAPSSPSPSATHRVAACPRLYEPRARDYGD